MRRVQGRLLGTAGLAATLLLASSSAHADDARSTLAFVSGASTFFAGFAVGGVILGTANSSAGQDNAGWLTMEAGFTVAPIVAHAMGGTSTRGLFFAVPAATAWGATAGLFGSDPATIEHGSIDEQRAIWLLFGLGLLSGTLGIVDAALASDRARTIAVAPMAGRGRVGIVVGASL